MSKPKSVRIADHFAELTDPRRREVIYPLINVVVIAVGAVICGADDFVAIARLGTTKREWLAQFLDLETGIPSHDRFNAIFAAIKPAEFEKCLLSWITALHEITDGQVIAIDGKTLRRSFDAADSKAAIHMVSAWATANHISLGQVVVDAKSNEITAIPKLLEMLELSGAMVTIDAMGCQTEIARQIVAAGADYCLAVKDNQPTLHQGIINFFEKHVDDDFADIRMRCHMTNEEGHGRKFFEKHVDDNFADIRMRCHMTNEEGHGRKEARYYMICPVPEDLPDRARWTSLKAIGVAISDTQRDGKKVGQNRYYILSKFISARRFADAVRGHWSIENRLHWQLDVTFQEDQCRIRQGHADANFSILRRAALSLLKNETALKVGIKNKRLTAGWDESYLQKVLLGT